jgi:tryptophan-rich hypothetical protein
MTKHQINPKKLMRSKWTSTSPKNKEKHFLVTDVAFDEEGIVISCVLESVMSKTEYAINWRDLKDITKWRQGWK